MRQADIFLFTSGFEEGWGAVLNESMNCGCAVVASHAIGSVPYLIKNKYNGIIYKYKDIENMYDCVEYLMDSVEEREKIGRNAYKTIINEWNENIAAYRVLKLIKNYSSGEFYDTFQDGPCSKAEIIKNGWM